MLKHLVEVTSGKTLTLLVEWLICVLPEKQRRSSGPNGCGSANADSGTESAVLLLPYPFKQIGQALWFMRWTSCCVVRTHGLLTVRKYSNTVGVAKWFCGCVPQHITKLLLSALF